MLRMPVVLVYCTMGLVLGGLLSVAPDFLTDIGAVTQKYFPEEYASSGVKPDLMVPVFITKYLPHGVIGLLMVGILSAAMSSLSSTVNSLSAVSVEDFFNRGKKKLEGKKYMAVSKAAVVFWGGVCIACAFLLGGSESSVIEIINAIGSVFYGPVLATFLLAIFSKKVNKYGMNAGIIASVLINLIFSKTMQEIIGFDPGVDIFWIWLNFTGFGLCVGIAYIVSTLVKDQNNKSMVINYKLRLKDIFIKESYILIAFFIAIVIFSYYIPQIFA
jgi:Na+/proline symporter